MNIGIFYGHSKPYDGGAVGIRPEFDLIREYAPLVKQELEQLGHKVIICSSDSCTSSTESLTSRVQRANNYNLNLVLDLHCNAFNGTAHGCEVLHFPTSNVGKSYATKIVTELSKLGYTNRGAKADVRGLYTLKATKAPCVIVEPFFCDSKVDMSLYNAKKIASAIVRGITGTNYVAPVAPTSPYKPSLEAKSINALQHTKASLEEALSEINTILKEVK